MTSVEKTICSNVIPRTSGRCRKTTSFNIRIGHRIPIAGCDNWFVLFPVDWYADLGFDDANVLWQTEDTFAGRVLDARPHLIAVTVLTL